MNENNTSPNCKQAQSFSQLQKNICQKIQMGGEVKWVDTMITRMANTHIQQQ